MPAFADIADYEEDDRIKIIAHQVTVHHMTVVFIVEDNAKADRYMQKLHGLDHSIREIDRLPNVPTKGMITVKIGPQVN